MRNGLIDTSYLQKRILPCPDCGNDLAKLHVLKYRTSKLGSIVNRVAYVSCPKCNEWTGEYNEGCGWRDVGLEAVRVWNKEVINKMVSKDEALLASDAKVIADKVNATRKEVSDRLLEERINKLISDLFDDIAAAAKEGKYKIMTSNLAAESLSKDIAYLPEYIEERFKQVIRETFNSCGYKVSGNSNYLDISWGYDVK